MTVDRKGSVGRGLCISLPVAAALFSLIFTSPVLGFWTQLAASTVLLAGMAFLFDGAALKSLLRPRWPAVILSICGGLAAAMLLYGAFFIGRATLLWLFPWGHSLIGSIYDLGDGVSAWQIALLLLFVVGPCEEIFWRGYVQRRLQAAYGWRGVVMTCCIYAGVHVASGNPVLIVAALVCGIFWGALFALSDNLAVNVVSHGIWAAAAFAVVPLA